MINKNVQMIDEELKRVKNIFGSGMVGEYRMQGAYELARILKERCRG